MCRRCDACGLRDAGVRESFVEERETMGNGPAEHRARLMLRGAWGRSEMSRRTHFWLRVAGLTVILAAEFAPRFLPGSPTAAQPVVASVGRVR